MLVFQDAKMCHPFHMLSRVYCSWRRSERRIVVREASDLFQIGGGGGGDVTNLSPF